MPRRYSTALGKTNEKTESMDKPIIPTFRNKRKSAAGGSFATG
jgi:hypothetical protein